MTIVNQLYPSIILTKHLLQLDVHRGFIVRKFSKLKQPNRTLRLTDPYSLMTHRQTYWPIGPTTVKTLGLAGPRRIFKLSAVQNWSNVFSTRCSLHCWRIWQLCVCVCVRLNHFQKWQHVESNPIRLLRDGPKGTVARREKIKAIWRDEISLWSTTRIHPSILLRNLLVSQGLVEGRNLLALCPERLANDNRLLV